MQTRMIYTTFTRNTHTATNAASMMTMDAASFCFTTEPPMSHTTDAITAPTPACIPESSLLMMKLSRNSS